MKEWCLIRRLKIAAVFLAGVIAFLGLTGVSDRWTRISASVFGPAPAHTNAPGEGNCTSCHVEFPLNSGSGGITITGLPANYKPGQQVELTVTLNQPDAVAYGFQLTAIDGRGRPAGAYTLPSSKPAPLQQVTGFVNGVERRYVEHTSNGVTPTQFGTKSWTFTWTAPQRRVGKIDFYAAGNAADSDGSTNGDRIFTTARSSLSGSAISSFDNDGRSDVAVFRPSTGVWYSLNSSGFQAVSFGQAGDVIVPGDYDGDGTTDRAVFRPSESRWYIVNPAGFFVTHFGQAGDVPVPGDYDGDLKTDVAVWRPSGGTWYILRSSDGGFQFREFGQAGDLPVQADFDADAKTDLAVYRPQSGTWYFLMSGDGSFAATGFGVEGDRPVQADYDGDGRADIAVFRPSDNTWYLLKSTAGYTVLNFGAAGDQPTPADFDGDGKTDIAVYRPSDATWYLFATLGPTFSAVNFGESGDVPVPLGYLAD